jgi:hypothetical protein
MGLSRRLQAVLAASHGSTVAAHTTPSSRSVRGVGEFSRRSSSPSAAARACADRAATGGGSAAGVECSGGGSAGTARRFTPGRGDGKLRAVVALDPQPDAGAVGPRALRRLGGGGPASARLRRLLGRLHVSRRWLDRCFAARAGAWLARANGLGFGVMALVTSRPLPEARSAVLRLALIAFSWSAGLAALSLAGPGPERWLAEGRALLDSRGVGVERFRAERPLMLARWCLERLGAPVLLVIAGCIVGSPEPWRSLESLGLAAGALLYVASLGLGLGAVAHLCERLGAGRGQSFFLSVLLLPELIAPAWPELPTLTGSYGRLLDMCLGLGS